jgi:hypothetical protein
MALIFSQSPSVASPETDVNDPFGDDDLGAKPLENISFVRGSPREQIDCYNERHHHETIPPVPVSDLGWSPDNSNSDESSNQSSPLNPTSYTDTTPYVSQPSPDSLSMSMCLRPYFPRVILGHTAPACTTSDSSSSISNLEAGASMWAHDSTPADPVYKSTVAVNQFGSWVGIFDHISHFCYSTQVAYVSVCFPSNSGGQ